MYVDKFDGRVDVAFFDRKATEWHFEQNRLLATIEEYQSANQTYLEEGVQLLELARRAHVLFQKQEAREKRRLLNFLLSNCTWKNGELTATFRQPLDILAAAATAHQKAKAAGATSDSLSDIWRPQRDLNPCCRLERANYQFYLSRPSTCVFRKTPRFF